MSTNNKCHVISSFSNIKTILPGIPSNPTNIAVIILSPKWNPQVAPITFINKINIPPNKELIINFSIIFRGIMNILPIRKITIIPAKYAIKVFESKLNHLTTINIMF